WRVNRPDEAFFSEIPEPDVPGLVGPRHEAPVRRERRLFDGSFIRSRKRRALVPGDDRWKRDRRLATRADRHEEREKMASIHAFSLDERGASLTQRSPKKRARRPGDARGPAIAAGSVSIAPAPS